ncbi:MAG: hypothetical protein E7655_06840 [Ruminococcaceae bacterium]|nr:hypothetical protein [Oscillospiraceae bacterium]
MTCPYCGAQTEKGLIASNHELCWISGEKRPLFNRAEFHEGSVLLSEQSFLRGSAVEAHLCRSCRKIVIDYADPTSDFNRR